MKYDSEEELKNDTKMTGKNFEMGFHVCKCTRTKVWLLTEEQKAFYTLFWSTQSFLTNPPSIFAEANYEKFKEVY